MASALTLGLFHTRSPIQIALPIIFRATGDPLEGWMNPPYNFFWKNSMR